LEAKSSAGRFLEVDLDFLRRLIDSSLVGSNCVRSRLAKLRERRQVPVLATKIPRWLPYCCKTCV
ncbi:MAG: hypothetical protein AAGA03_18260, partial [Planctomycetota bacterium]